MAETKYTGLEIAVIGLSGTFQGASDLDQFWNNIREGKTSMRSLTDEELIESGQSEEELKDTNFVKMSARIEGKEFFDSAFFGYSPDEAALMEPQIRLLHQCVWHAIEDAGISDTIKKASVGLYAGASHNHDWEVNDRFFQDHANIGNLRASTLNKTKFVHSLISYNLGLKGPAVYVDSACSTSLLAIHLASRSLLTGDSKIALAGGVALNASKKLGYIYSENGIASVDGQCRSFNEGSSGTIGGEGVGVVVLKKLQDAIKDGDNIHAVIKGSAINNDGQRKVGFTAPSIEGQAECIRLAQKMSKVKPESIGYIETHGSGTKLGDQIEVSALKQIFDKIPSFSCPIGSIKSNIGHLDSTAGVAGFIKTVLMLKNKEIPAAAHAERPLPELSWGTGKLQLNSNPKKWERIENQPLRAGINSFGIGGTNVHVVLEEAPELPEGKSSREAGILTFSAKTSTAFDNGVEKLKTFIRKEEESALSDISYSLQTGRASFPYRGSIAYKNKEDLLGKIEKLSSLKTRDRSDHTIFVFSGVGSHYQEVCKELYGGEQLFKEQFDSCAEAILESVSIDVKSYLLDSGAVNIDTLNETYLLFTIEYSLAQLLISLGIHPKGMIGYSFGEYVAATVSGVMDIPTALKLIKFRNKLIAESPAGKMLSVPVPFKQLQGILEEGVYLSIDNGSSCVVAGKEDNLKAFEQKLMSNRILCAWLNVDKAMHSPLFDSDAMTSFVSKLKFNSPEIPYLSCVTGTWITEEDLADPAYWSKHLTQSVLFAQGLGVLLEEERNLFVEIGIGNDVGAIVSRELMDRKRKERVFSFIRPEGTAVSDVYYFSFQLAKIWQHGVSVNWKSWYSIDKHTTRSVPGYCFDRFAYPSEVDIMGSIGSMVSKMDMDQIGTTMSEWLFYPTWKFHAPLKGNAKYREHIVFNTKETEALCETLTNTGDRVIRVECGNEYIKHSVDSYIIDFNNKNDYNRLFKSISEDGIEAPSINYAWNLLTDGKTFEATPENKEFQLVFLAPVYLASAAHKHCPGSAITLITNRLFEVIGSENDRNYASSLSRGILSVIPQEFDLRVRHVDIEKPEEIKQLVKLMRHEVSERTLALRNGRLWVESYERGESFTEYNQAVKKNGTYLVIGGTGLLGELLTKNLIINYDAHVILLGRRDENSVGDVLENYRTSGGKVDYLSCDITDIGSFSDAFKRIEEMGIKLNGIVHAGPSTNRSNYELLEDITPVKACSIIQPKLAGIQNLYSLAKDMPLDFVWINSSVASVVGGIALGAYSASCSYSDHFLQSHQSELPNWFTVQIGKFDETAEEGNTELERNPLIFMNRQEFWRVFDATTVRDGGILLAVGKENMTADMKAAQDARPMTAQNEEGVDFSVERINRERPDLATEYRAPETEIENALVDIIGDIFGMSGIGIDDSFIELGGNSIVAVILVRKIKSELNVSLTINDILSNNSLALVATLIEDINIISKETERTSKLEI